MSINQYWQTLIILGSVLLTPLVQAFEAFTVENIRIEGLRRISAGTVFNYLPTKVGDRFAIEDSAKAISALYQTGLFKDVRLAREDEVLIVTVEERPAISEISFDGNKNLETDELRMALKSVDFAEGRVFNQSLLEQVEQELQRQYFNLGKYAVKLQSTVTPLTRNRVRVHIDISEGATAKIHRINFVGNTTFDDEELSDQMSLSTTNWLSWITNDDQYSKQKLGADLESIRSYYLDRGYINFEIDSTQVSITPDRKDVYITVNVTEGEKYSISEVKLVGDLIVEEADLMDKITIFPGDTFSRKEIIASTEAVSDRIGDEGYAFANINPVPELNPDGNTVSLTFFVDPGRRAYVRRINFKGNHRTRDEVIRREMRQMESAWIATSKVKRSKERLERLGYFDEVNVETPLVPNSNDLVDINYSLVERPAGNLLAGVGYSQTQGVLFNASATQDNFLGTGKRVGVAFNNSRVNTIYSFSYLNPYVNVDGVSRGFKLFYRTTDAERANLSRYSTDVYGGSVNYGIPISEYNRIRLGGAYDHTQLETTDSSAQEVFDFIDENGNTYNSYRLTASWSRDTRNRAIFPDRGSLQSFSAEVAVPLSDLEYYKLSYKHQWLYPLTKDFILMLKGDVAYGDGYGDIDDLPFFENFVAGGPRSVRGFEENTLGPLDSNDRALGGNLKTVGNLELILPVPFATNVRQFRMSAFVDFGNVYSAEEDFDVSEFRYSTGLSAIWISPLGALSFSLARPLKSEDGDQTQIFQFSIGTTF